LISPKEGVEMKLAVIITTIGTTAVFSTATGAAAPVILPKQCMVARTVICISKADRKLRFIRTGRVALTMDARFGDARGPGFRTAEGMFSVFRKVAMDYSQQYDNAPMPYSMYFHGGQAIHYSYSFAREGYNGSSHGCVNIRDMAKIRWMFNRVLEGTPVYIY